MLELSLNQIHFCSFPYWSYMVVLGFFNTNCHLPSQIGFKLFNFHASICSFKQFLKFLPFKPLPINVKNKAWVLVVNRISFEILLFYVSISIHLLSSDLFSDLHLTWHTCNVESSSFSEHVCRSLHFLSLFPFKF